MKLKSSAFKNGQNIPRKFTCEGDNVNPPLEILDVPAQAKSLVLIVNDPNAPNGDWIHWTLWNIAPKAQEIKKNSKPAGATEGLTDSGKPGYGGPCPPAGTHVYLFKLYAIDILLPADPRLTKKEIRKMIEGHIIEKTLLRGFYERAHSENF